MVDGGGHWGSSGERPLMRGMNDFETECLRRRMLVARIREIQISGACYAARRMPKRTTNALSLIVRGLQPNPFSPAGRRQVGEGIG